LNIILIAIACLIPYLIGSVNFSILISRFKGEDIRNSGSGNAGATNMLRTYGKLLAIITLICDVLKGVAGILFGTALAYFAANVIVPASGTNTGISVSQTVYDAVQNTMHLYPLLGGLFVILGHNFPVFFKFKGGKGVATSLGVILTLNWQVGLIVAAFALIIMATTKYVSLGSVMAAVIYIAVDLSFMIFTENFSIYRLIFDLLISALLIFRHRANIKRLLNGTENKLGKKKEV